MPKRDWVMREMEVIAVHKETGPKKNHRLGTAIWCTKLLLECDRAFFPCLSLKTERENIYVLEIPKTLGLNLSWSFGAGWSSMSPMPAELCPMGSLLFRRSSPFKRDYLLL
jgi:hypothetical protein